MGVFGWFGKKGAPEKGPSESESRRDPAAATTALTAETEARLARARGELEAGRREEAVEAYRSLLSEPLSGELLARISGDLGSAGCLEEMVEVVAPAYAAERHGPSAGINLLQACLRLKRIDPAEHLLHLLFDLERPELEERLHGFATALDELKRERERARGPVNLATVTLSKPLWYYGLEEPAWLLPPPADSDRVVVVSSLSVLADGGSEEAFEERRRLGRIGRAFSLLLAERFYFRRGYAPIALFPVHEETGLAHLGAELTRDNIAQIAGSLGGPCDYVVSGAISKKDGAFELTLQIWEAARRRERKKFGLRCAEDEWGQAMEALLSQLAQYMEAGEEKSGGIALPAPGSAFEYAMLLERALWFFLAGKKCVDKKFLGEPKAFLAEAARLAGASPPPSPEALLFLASLAQDRRLGLEPHRAFAAEALRLVEAGGPEVRRLRPLVAALYTEGAEADDSPDAAYREWVGRTVSLRPSSEAGEG